MNQELQTLIMVKFMDAYEFDGVVADPYGDADEVIRMVAREILLDIGYLAWQERIVVKCFGDSREIGAKDALLKIARWVYQGYVKEEEWNYTD